MTEPDPDVVDAVEAFLTRHNADPAKVHASGLRTITGAERDEIAAALEELAVRENGTGPTR